MAAPTAAVRRDMYVRDNGQCYTCGAVDGLSFQHRRADGMGGSKVQPGVPDGVTACIICNGRYETDLQTIALGYGWKVRKWADPLLVPAFHAPTYTWYRFEGIFRHIVTAVVAWDMMHAVYGEQYLGWRAEADETLRARILYERGT